MILSAESGPSAPVRKCIENQTTIELWQNIVAHRRLFNPPRAAGSRRRLTSDGKAVIPFAIGFVSSNKIGNAGRPVSLQPRVGSRSMRVEDFDGRTPRLAPETFFDGQVRAWGLFEDRFGRLRRQFTVDIEGEWDGEILTLTEDFVYDDGEQERRVWRVTRIDENTYEGTADDIVGKASGRCFGNAIKWTYIFALKVSGRELQVKFDDWMFQQNRDVVINRALVTKWGFEVGSVSIFFLRNSQKAA